MLKYIKSILLVYFAWVILWLPYYVIEYSSLYSESLFNLIAALSRRILFAGIVPYWYLLVLAESALLLVLLIYRKWNALGWFLCILGLLLGTVYSFQSQNNTNGIVYKLFYAVFSGQSNIVMTGFPFMFLGYVLNHFEERFKRINFWILLLCYSFTIVAAFGVFYFFHNMFFIPFSTIEALLLAMLGVASPSFQNRIPVVLCKFSRNLSVVIFLTHTVFLAVLGYVFNLWNDGVRFMLTILGAILLYFIAKKLNWKPLNTLLMIK